MADAEGLDMFAADARRGGVAYVDLWDGRQEAALERMREAVEAAKAASRISMVRLTRTRTRTLALTLTLTSTARSGRRTLAR